MGDAALPVGPPQPRWRPRPPEAVKRTALIGLAFFALALLLYGPGLAMPDTIVFDETHYVSVARHYLDGEYVNLTLPEKALPYNYEHPPLAKYFLFASMSVFGDNPTGWRFASYLVGAAGVPAAYLLARRLFDSEVAGVAAGVLLLLENQYFLHSGMAMLEVFPTTFCLWAFALALGPDNEARAASILYGMAVASKYNALFLMPLFFALQWMRAPAGNPYLRAARASAWAVAVPIGVWLLSYLPMFVQWVGHGGVGYAAAQFVIAQVAAATWDFAADATHPDASHPITWIPMIVPVFYYVRDPGTGLTAQIYSVGNPAVWWPGAALAVFALTWVPWRMLRPHAGLLVSSRFWASIEHFEISWSPRFRWFFAGLLFLFSWAPFMVLQRVTFHYYMTFTTPYFAILGGAAVAWAVRQGGRWRWAVGAYGAVTLLAFVFYLPLSEGFAVPAWWNDAEFGMIPWMQR